MKKEQLMELIGLGLLDEVAENWSDVPPLATGLFIER